MSTFKSGVASFFVLGAILSAAAEAGEKSLFRRLVLFDHKTRVGAYRFRRPFDFHHISLALATHRHDTIITHRSVESVAIILPLKRQRMAVELLPFVSPFPLETTTKRFSTEGIIMETNDEGETALPFSRVVTPQLVQELDLFQDEIRQEYAKKFDSKGQVSRENKNGDESDNHNDQDEYGSPNKIPLYTWEDVSIESVLGEGAFSFVFQVAMNESSKDKLSKNTSTTTGMTAPPQTSAHALKCLKAKAIEIEDDLRYNAMDLMTEAYILSHTNHPHIISVSGLAKYSLGDSFASSDGYFLLLEIMETTLLDNMNGWRKELAYSKIRRKQLLSADGMEKRLYQIALPIINALVYLHNHNVVLRDLKPENVGFDAQGNLKLFDFGLARLLQQLEDGEMAGSVCYMAPEVLLEAGTGLKSDVYSLAMIIWELTTLEYPMAQFQTMDQIQHRVAKGNWRPSLSKIPIRSLRNTIQKGWAPNMIDRVSAKEMEKLLRGVCGAENADDDASESNAPSIQSLPASIGETKTEYKDTHRRAQSFALGPSVRALFRKKKG